jgi:uncharacterized protein (TIGR03067 family)
VGDWVGTDNDGLRVCATMRSDNRLVFRVGRDSVDGTWSLDETANPARLDFRLDTEDQLTMRMIARLGSEDTLQIRIDDSDAGSRPTAFLESDDNDEQLTLRRDPTPKS